ncbi:MAG: TVP38/TMEM64 family protein [Kineosporiaceae bacterium]
MPDVERPPATDRPGSPAPAPAPAPARGFWARHWQKAVAAAIWVTLVASFLGYGAATGSSPTETVRDLVDLLRSPWGPLLYIAVYTVRPLAFFSAVVVTLLGGAIWGPVLGTLYVVVGSNLSATVAYLFGRVLGRDVLPSPSDGTGTGSLAARYADRLRREAFVAILVMRLVYLPYDLVNYLAGFLRVRYRPFLAATVLGSLPGTLTFVLAGASLDIDDVFAGRISVSTVNPWTLALSAVLFVAGLVVSRLLRRREAAS